VNAPLITAIVSTYRGGSFLAECLQNLEDQTYAKFLEIVVVDAASPENEGEIVKDFQKRYSNIQYFRTATRIGVYEAWNVAIKAAKGKYLISASTNDQLAKNSLEMLARELDSHSEVALVYGDSYQTETPHKTFEKHTRTGVYEWPEYSYEGLLQSCQVGPHPMWRRALHDEIGFFDEKFVACGDQDFWLRLGQNYPLKHIKEFTGLYWVSPGGLSRKGNLPMIESAQVRACYQKAYIEKLRTEAKSLVQSGSKSAAVALSKKLNVFTLQCAQWFGLLAEARSKSSFLNEAIEALKEAIALVPDQAMFVRSLLRLYAVQKRFQEGIQFLKSTPAAVSKDPEIQCFLNTAQLESKIEVGEHGPKVTAIVSTYNSERYIRGCLDSLVSQTLGSALEILVVNSGSQQGEEAIVQEYQRKHSNIRYVRTERETIYASWARAVAMARGKYLTNANTDDAHRSDALEKMASELDRRDVGIVYSDTFITSKENETFERNTASLVWNQPDFSVRQMLMYCPFGPQPMWKRSVHEEIGNFDPKYTIAGDYEFFLRIAWKYGAYHIPEILGLFLLHEKSLSHADQPKLMSEVTSFLSWYRIHIPIEEIYGIPSKKSDRVKASALAHFGTSLIVSPFSNFLETEQLYRMALELAEDPAVTNNLALILLQQGKRAESLQLLRYISDRSEVGRENLKRLENSSGAKPEMIQIPLDFNGFDIKPILPSELSIIPVQKYSGKSEIASIPLSLISQ
jgi:glycosyltransferase involved in cell wall biosynthesis